MLKTGSPAMVVDRHSDYGDAVRVVWYDSVEHHDIGKQWLGPAALVLAALEIKQ